MSGALRASVAGVAEATLRSSPRLPSSRLSRPTQPGSSSSSPAFAISPLKKMEPELADAEHRERQNERHEIIEQPEDQQAGEQFLGIELPQRDQHGGIEHT